MRTFVLILSEVFGVKTNKKRCSHVNVDESVKVRSSLKSLAESSSTFTVDVRWWIVNERSLIGTLNLTLKARGASVSAPTCKQESSRAAWVIHWLLLFLDPLFIAARLSGFILLDGPLLLKGARTGGTPLFSQSCCFNLLWIRSDVAAATAAPAGFM